MLGLLRQPAFRSAMGFAALGGASLALGDNRFTVACEEEAPEPHAEGLAAVPEDEENFLEDSEFRYAGYTGRVGRVLATTAKAVGTKVRYVGYASDVGESSRPLMNPKYVKYFYGVTWAYVFADVGYQGYKADQAGADSTGVARSMTRTLAFQSIASVALPSLIIHQAVHATQKALVNSSKTAMRYGPVAVGFAILPLLPFVDEPVEELIFHAFDMVWPGDAADPGHAGH